MSDESTPLKYAAEIVGFDQCPPPSCAGREIEAFRFVHNPILDEDFLPHAIRWPTNKGFKKCVGYAISLFESATAAQTRFLEIYKWRPQIAQKSGNHIAKGRIDARLGYATSADRSGHFSFFECDGVELKAHFEIVGPIDA